MLDNRLVCWSSFSAMPRGINWARKYSRQMCGSFRPEEWDSVPAHSQPRGFRAVPQKPIHSLDVVLQPWPKTQEPKRFRLRARQFLAEESPKQLEQRASAAAWRWASSPSPGPRWRTQSRVLDERASANRKSPRRLRQSIQAASILRWKFARWEERKARGPRTTGGGCIWDAHGRNPRCVSRSPIPGWSQSR